MRWKRILLKLSGETLGGKGNTGVDVSAMDYITGEIEDASRLGCEIAVVIGGGNFIRGSMLSTMGIDRATADYMGMLGTVINGLALQNMLEKRGLITRVMTSLIMTQVAEPFIRRRAMRHLEKKRVVIFAGGTGNPYFSTDTAAALRASEIGAEAILKATNVEGVYTHDPKKNPNAQLIKEVDPIKMLEDGLRVMDLTAVTFAMENKLPIVVFDVFTKGNLKRVILGEKIGSELKIE
ncbi:MAG: UMP kinase [bacterium]|nr:UMP kinase [bacterium]